MDMRGIALQNDGFGLQEGQQAFRGTLAADA
jgi:hypothetical protein